MKGQHEIVGWRYSTKENLEKIRLRVKREGGQVLINPRSRALGGSRGLSALPRSPQDNSTTTGENVNPPSEQASAPGAGEVGTVGGSSVPFHYEVREAGELRTSHHWNSFAENPDYQREVPGAQRRKRDTANAVTQVLDIAEHPNPARLADAPLAQQGAPTIDAEGHVIAGNGRAMGITRGYRVNRSMNGYRQYLRDNAARFGVDPTTIDGMKEPVLVRVGDFADAEHKERFADDANVQETMQLTAAEQAAADQYLLTDEVLKSLVPHPAGHINTQDNNPFIRRIIGRISPSDRGNMLNGQELSQNGVRRIRAALVLKAFGDPRLVEQLYEETDANSKNVLHAMEAIAPRLAKLRADGKPDIAKPLLDVIRTLFSVRQSGKHLEDFIGNGNLFSAYDVDSSPCAWRQRADRGHHGAGASDLPWRARSSTLAPGQTDDAGSGPGATRGRHHQRRTGGDQEGPRRRGARSPARQNGDESAIR